MQFTSTDFRSFLRQLGRPRPLNQREQCRQLLHRDIQVKLFAKSRFVAASRRRRRRNVGAQRLLKLENVPIEGEDLGGAGVALGQFYCPLDAFVPISLFHRRSDRHVEFQSCRRNR